MFKNYLLNSKISETESIMEEVKEILKRIPHTKGEHPPNKNGYLLWDSTCFDNSLICLKCGYIEYWGCAEDFDNDIIEKFMPELEGSRNTNYCRNCGNNNSQIEISGKTWLKIIIGE